MLLDSFHVNCRLNHYMTKMCGAACFRLRIQDVTAYSRVEEILVVHKTFIVLAGCLLSLSTLARGAGKEDPESFRIEVSGSSWLLNTSGNVQSSGTVIDFVSDLGFEQRQPTFYGKLVFKPGRKHRLILEGSPFSFSGLNTIHRSVTYQGETFNVDQTLKTTSTLEYIFAGYQYDVIRRPAGHLGFSVGGAYMNAGATILSVQEANTATGTQQLGLPLIGAEFRVFPLPSHKWIDIDGGVRGVALGSYGHYVEGQANAGVWIGPISLQGGYRIVNADLHQAGSDPGGIALHMRGPIFTLLFQW